MHMDNHHAIRYFENSYIFIKQYRFIWLLWFLAATLYNVDASLDIQRLRTPTAKGCDKPCNNGHCVNGTCVCQQGWGGLQCDHCFGRVRINGSNSGFFTDGLFNYTASARCTWIITSEQNSSLLLRLADFFTECCWDNLYIYDGDSAFDNLIGAFSGSLPPTEVVATSGKSIVYFTSDLAFNMMGFNITYQYNACPRNCSGRGNCVNGKCGCPSGYTGEACEVPFCANGVEATASPDGPCLNGGYCEDGKCNCNKDLFHGEFCQVFNAIPVWDTLYSYDGQKFTPRASHAVVLVEDQVWIYGGAYFTSTKKPTDLVVYNITSQTFFELQGEKNSPMSRYDHTMVFHNNKLYVFGGVVNQNYITNELWSLDMNSLKWTLEFENDNSSLALPMAVAGHTAHVIGNEMHVLFGYNPYEGYLYQVQIYSFGSRRWRKGKIDPVISGRFGHSSILSTTDYEKKHTVFVYGGYNAPINTYSYAISDQLLMYDPVDETWTEIGKTGLPLFRHSSVLLNGVIYIFGGNSHNESSSKQSDCYSPKILAYDITCQEWMSLNSTDEKFVDSLPRYGHAAVPYNGSFLVLGGFTGQMKSDVLKFTLGQCKAQARDADDCVNSADGIRCVFVGKSCIQARPAISYRQNFVNFIKNDSPRLQAECPQRQQATNFGRPCAELEDCRSCFSQKGCSWCESTQMCVSGDGCIDGSMLTTDWKNCAMSQRKKANNMISRPCALSTNCYACRQLPHCSWVTIESKQRCISQIDEAMLIEEHNRLQAERFAAYSRALATTSNGAHTTRPSDAISFPLTQSLSQNLTCPVPCAQYSSCQNCVIANCMWCGSTQRCVSMDTYMISFPYGQCQSWTTVTNADKNHICQQDPNDCEMQKTCIDCQLVGPRCGWCDDGSGTGLGKCLPGSDSGPLVANSCPLKRWYFTGQPACQCNGHSNCTINTATPMNKCRNCTDRTTGEHCETCIDGYFGDPRNGGECQVCQCNNQATSCDPDSGDCYCTTKGVTGPHCDKCEPKYTGDPKNDVPCTYELVIDFIFTFKLDGDDAKDKHVNQINFYSTPFKKDTDVQFSITCEGESNAKVAINLTSNFFEGHPGNMKALMANTNCTASGIKRTYSATSPDYAFGTEANTTFLVRVYDFETPIKIQISFAQSPPINWVLFFVIFAACFIVLLVVAGLLWMIKLRVEWYRNLRRRHDEIEEMASRPFGSVQLELLMNKTDSHATPVAIEPCSNYNAGIYTLIVRLPTGGKEYTPNGTSGLAVASSLCLLTQAQLALLQPPDPSDQRQGRKSTLRRFIPFMRP